MVEGEGWTGEAKCPLDFSDSDNLSRGIENIPVNPKSVAFEVTGNLFRIYLLGAQRNPCFSSEDKAGTVLIKRRHPNLPNELKPWSRLMESNARIESGQIP